MNDFPCICGHNKLDHPDVGRYDYIYCEGCFRKEFPFSKFKNGCKVYKADNLKYLEQLYESKL